MIKLQIHLAFPGCAQGKYLVKAKGFFLASLFWADSNGPLSGWGPMGYVPIDPAGNGCFFFPNARAIPRDATHVLAHCVSHDFQESEDALAEIPADFLPADASDQAAQRFSVLTDLHLSAKPWRVKQALKAAESDVLFLLGDSANDGEQAQFDLFQECIRDAAPDKVIFPVPGNHDIVHPKIMPQGTENYRGFQASLLERAEAKGYPVEYHPDSLAYAVRVGRMDVIGLQCVTDGRRFLFPEGKQLDWLSRHLDETKDAARHILLCHAPLLHHNPNRSIGMPYLNRDRELQAILDSHANILFLSGHTHVSPNLPRSNAEWDAERNNIYLDCGSGVETDTSNDQGLMAADWKDGCVTELTVSPDAVEICMKSIHTGLKFPRGYYRFPWTAGRMENTAASSESRAQSRFCP